MKDKVLILIGEGYGNTIMATPLISAIHQLGYSVSVLLRANWCDTFELLRGWDAIDRIFLSRVDARNYNWDIVVGTVWAKCDLDISARQHIQPFPLDLRTTHEAVVNMTCANQLGWKGSIPPTHCECISFSNENVSLGKYIVVCPGYGGHNREEWKRKSWPHWNEFVSQFDNLVGLGSQVDSSLIKSNLRNAYWGSLSIGQAAYLISCAECVVSVDNGLAHISAALGKKTVVLFGPTSEFKNRPLGENVILVKTDMKCRPCQRTQRWRGCLDWKCMEAISPGMVMEVM